MQTSWDRLEERKSTGTSRFKPSSNALASGGIFGCRIYCVDRGDSPQFAGVIPSRSECAGNGLSTALDAVAARRFADLGGYLNRFGPVLLPRALPATRKPGSFFPVGSGSRSPACESAISRCLPSGRVG